jgi:hypothetical protein
MGTKRSFTLTPEVSAIKESHMPHRIPLYRILAAVTLGATLFLASFTLTAEEQPTIVVVHTFEVHTNAKGFIKMINEAIKASKESDPDGSMDIYVLAGHVEPQSASQFIVYTAYPSMDDYIANKTALENDPKMQALGKSMDEAGFNMISQSINTLVAEY